MMGYASLLGGSTHYQYITYLFTSLFSVCFVFFLVLGGDAKLLVMLCISPHQKYLTESMQSLGFGTRARQVQRGQVKKKNFPVQSKAK